MPKQRVSHNQRSLKLYRSQGYTVEMVEHWRSFTNQRVDLFGIIDALAIKEGEIIGIQICGYTGASAHRKKLRESPYLNAWLSSGAKLHLLIWKKVGRKYQPKVEEY